MVTLPQRKVRFYEAVTRLRDDKDQILTADDFIATAEAGGLIGRIDHMVMLRCVQVLRRLMVRNKDVGVFCNVSAATLANPTTFRAMPRFPRSQSRAGAVLRARIQAGHVPQSRSDRDRASRRTVAARLPFLDRPCQRSPGRAARTRRPRRPLHQGAGGAAARSQAELDIGHPPLRPVGSARPLRHRPDRRKDRGRARGGRSPGFRRPVRPGLPVCAAPAVAARGGICYRRGDFEQPQWFQWPKLPQAPLLPSPARPSNLRRGRPAMPRWRAAPPDRANRRPMS